MADDQDKVPEEIEEQCVEVHHAVATVDRALRPLLSKSRAGLEETLSPLDNASLSLLLCYTMNSLFWGMT